MTSLAGLLRNNPNYRYTWMGQVVSEAGDYFNNVAVLALVMEKTGSGMVVSGVFLSRAIPAVLAGPIGRLAGPFRPPPHHDRERSDSRAGGRGLHFHRAAAEAMAAVFAECHPDVRFALLYRRARRHPAQHRHEGRDSRGEFPDTDHQLGHSHSRHIAGWIGRSQTRLRCGLCFECSFLCIFRLVHLEDCLAARLRTPGPDPPACGTSWMVFAISVRCPSWPGSL